MDLLLRHRRGGTRRPRRLASREERPRRRARLHLLHRLVMLSESARQSNGRCHRHKTRHLLLLLLLLQLQLLLLQPLLVLQVLLLLQHKLLLLRCVLRRRLQHKMWL